MILTSAEVYAYYTFKTAGRQVERWPTPLAGMGSRLGCRPPRATPHGNEAFAHHALNIDTKLQQGYSPRESYPIASDRRLCVPGYFFSGFYQSVGR
jgi:hypothetical protein